jgi:hypothetical protein
MMGAIIEQVLKILAAILLWLILFPVVLLLATPFILIFSIVGKNQTYPKRVANGYGSVYDFWYACGFWCLPW